MMNKGEAEFSRLLSAIDDGSFRGWHSVSPPGGTEADFVLIDPSGHFVVEVKAWSARCWTDYGIDDKEVRYAEGNVGSAPWRQAEAAMFGLLNAFHRATGTAPWLVPIAALPCLSRAEWSARFPSGPLAERGTAILFRDDFTDLATFRARLGAARASRARTGRWEEVINVPAAAERFEREILGRTGETDSAASPSAELVRVGTSVETPEDTVRRAERFLAGPAAWTAVPVAPLSALVKELDRPTGRTRVSVVGEFKSGKSSLINALIGRDVCYVGTFEATQVPALYVTGEPEGVTVEFDNGTTEAMDLGRFLASCEARALGEAVSATVTLTNDFGYDLADSPGLGTNTGHNSRRAEAEILRSNLLVWAVDASDPGSAQEGAFLSRAKEIGLPVLVALTKADMLDEAEIEDVLGYLADETGMERTELIALSARRHRSEGDAGVRELQSRIAAIVGGGAAIEDSRRAKLVEAVDVADRLVGEAVRLNEGHLRVLNAELGYFSEAARAAREASLRRWREQLVRRLRAWLGGLSGTEIASESRFDEEVRRALPRIVEDASREHAREFSEAMGDELRKVFADRAANFAEQIEALTSTSDPGGDLPRLKEEMLLCERRATAAKASAMESPALAPLVIAAGVVLTFVTHGMLPMLLGFFGGGALMGRLMRSDRSTEAEVRRLSPSAVDDLTAKSLDALAPQTAAVEAAVRKALDETARAALLKVMAERRGPTVDDILAVERGGEALRESLLIAREEVRG